MHSKMTHSDPSQTRSLQQVSQTSPSVTFRSPLYRYLQIYPSVPSSLACTPSHVMLIYLLAASYDGTLTSIGIAPLVPDQQFIYLSNFLISEGCTILVYCRRGAQAVNGEAPEGREGERDHRMHAHVPANMFEGWSGCPWIGPHHSQKGPRSLQERLSG
jgi:hypothetical protein